MNRVYKVKKLKLSSIFRGSVAVGIIPALLQFVVVLLSLVATDSVGEEIIFTILYCLFIPVSLGVIGVVLGLSYNWLSPKIGHIEVELEEVEK
ncbi:MAG: hypothetical protein RSA85_06170 [Cellulosilyticaceae bacterium]